MSPEDRTTLNARIEAALAESVKEFGEGVSPTGESRIVVPNDRLWALVNIADTREILTDRAVKALGGKGLSVTVSDEGVVIESSRSTPAPTVTLPAPDPAKPDPATA